MRENKVPAYQSRVPARGAPFRRSAGALSIVVAVLVGTAVSCSFNYGEPLAEDLADRTPDAVFSGFEHTIVQDNEPALRLKAEKAELYDRKNTVRLFKVRFTELRGGKVLSWGAADEATLKTDTEDAEFFGSVHLRSEQEGITISTEYLSWKSEDRVLESKPDQRTLIEKDNGSRVQGYGFRADARRKGISFTREVDGVLVRQGPEAEE